ncbi:MAG: class I SAM-dependent methyltransferase [Alphaproteobacteria bacterium]
MMRSRPHGRAAHPAVVVAEHIRPASGMRILDLGCGTADILAFLPDDVSYNGYDISPDYIARARSRFAGRGDFAARMPTPEEARTLAPFDVVMGIGVLHHMDDEAAADFFALARSVLKPGGRVVTLDPCYAPGQHPLAPLPHPPRPWPQRARCGRLPRAGREAVPARHRHVAAQRLGALHALGHGKRPVKERSRFPGDWLCCAHEKTDIAFQSPPT